MNSEHNPFEDSELSSILVVSDMKAARQFYLEQLGAELYREYGGNSTVIRFLGHWLLLVSGGGPTDDKPDISFVAPQQKQELSHSFTIRVKDCQQSYQILKNRGINFIRPPYDWGTELRCFFRDPDGHLWEISEAR